MLVICMVSSPTAVFADTSVPENRDPSDPAGFTESAETPEDTTITSEETILEETEAASEETIPEETEESSEETIPEETETASEETIQEETEEFSEESEFQPEISLFSLKNNVPGLEESILNKGTHVEQTYETIDHALHTIYWAKGVNPPSMTGNGSHRFVISREANYTTYQAPYAANNGYFDLNKPGHNVPGRPEHFQNDNRCYLGSAMNILYWWMNQNSGYIDWYLQELQSENSRFQQAEGLVDLKNTPWSDLRTPPVPVKDTTLYTQMMDSSALVKGPFKNNYQLREDGYFMDPVWDFFLNGYQAIQAGENDNNVPENSPDNFLKDKNGGYFYPVFGANPLSKRYSRSDFQFFQDHFKTWITGSTGVSLSYDSVSANHALTLWGAEYDEQGTLVRVYVTDTDDFQDPYQPGADVVRGLQGMNTINYGGVLFLSNRDDAQQNPGGRISGAATLRLGTEIWEKVRHDINLLPLPPEITVQPKGRSYHPGDSLQALSVKAQKDALDEELGTLSYQWYQADDSVYTNMKPVRGADKAAFTPDPGTVPGTYYYFCRVTTTKYEQTAFVDSASAAITITEGPIKSAQVPTVVFKNPYVGSSQIKKIEGYQGEKVILTVEGTADRGTLSYQWFRAGSYNSVQGFGNLYAIEGAVGQTLEAAVGSPDDLTGRAFYFCRVTNTDTSADINGAQSVYKDSAIIRLDALPRKQQQTSLMVENFPANPAYGEEIPLNVSGGSGTGRLTYQVIGDTMAEILQTDAGIRVKITGVGAFKILLTKQGDSTYETAQAEISVVSRKAAPDVGTVSFPGGSVIPSADPQKIVLSKTGKGKGTLALSEDTVLTPGSHSYTWVFTPENTDFYETVTGKITLLVQKKDLSIQAAGTWGIYNGLEQAGFKDLTSDPQWDGQWVITYRTAGGTLLQKAPSDAGKYSVTLSVPETDPDYCGSLEVSFEILKAPLNKITVPLTAPAADTVPIKSLTDDYYTAAVNWTPEHEKFQSDTAYSASIVLTPDHNHCFIDKTLADGESGILDPASGTLTLLRNFEKLPALPVDPAPPEDPSTPETPTDPALPDTPTVPQSPDYRVEVTGAPAISEGLTVWVDGAEVQVTEENGKFYADLPSADSKILTACSFAGRDSGDPHLQYPDSMQVYRISRTKDGKALIQHIPQLDDLLLYRGTSIRVQGEKGIRMITAVNEDVKQQLLQDLAGYQLLEYGTAAAWAENISSTNPLVIGSQNVAAKPAFSSSQSMDAVFGKRGNEILYTNVLVRFSMDECLKDFALRPYARLKDLTTGEEVVVYGGILRRSIAYVAQQNENEFPAGSEADRYVKSILNYAGEHGGI